MTTASWTLASWAMWMGMPSSPRMEAKGPTKTLGPMWTWPMTTAWECMKAAGSTTGWAILGVKGVWALLWTLGWSDMGFSFWCCFALASA